MRGIPENLDRPDGWIAVVGEPPDVKADESNDLNEDESWFFAWKVAQKNGVLDRLIYFPVTRCRPDDGRGDFLRLTKPQMKQCSSHFIAPLLKQMKLTGIIVSGPVAAYAIIGRMDMAGLSKVESRFNDHVPVRAVRGYEWREVDPDHRNKMFVDDWKRAYSNLLSEATTKKRELKYRVATNLKQVLEWFGPVFEDLEGPLAWDTETTGLKVWRSNFRVGVFSFFHRSQSEVLIVPLGHPNWKYQNGTDRWEQDHMEVEEILKKIMENRKIRKIGHNLQYDELACYSHFGWRVKGYLGDTMYNAYLTDPDQTAGKALDDLIKLHIPDCPPYWRDVDDWKRENKATWTGSYLEIPDEILFPYAAWDTALIPEIYEIQQAHFRQQNGKIGGSFVFNNDQGYFPTADRMTYVNYGRTIHHQLCTHLTRTGQKVDLVRAKEVRKEYMAKIAELDRDLESDPKLVEFQETVLGEVASKSSAQRKMFLLGQTPKINWASTAQQRAFFLDFLKLPVVSKTDTGNPSLDESAIREYSVNPKYNCNVAKILLKRRELDKFVTSFLDPMLAERGSDKCIVWDDGLVHSEVKGASVATGRLSYSKPNVSAIPRDGDVKSLYVARNERGWILTRDYSGIEVRIMALFSQDSELINAFNAGEDVHFRTQTHFFQDLADAKNKTQRSICKRCFFGNIYGQGDAGLHEMLSAEGIINPLTGKPITKEDCKQFNEKLYKAYPGVLEWVEKSHQYGVDHKSISSGFGFVRMLPALQSYDYYKQIKRTFSWDEIQSDRHMKRLSSEVAQDLRRAQNASVQSTAGDLTSFAAWRIQLEFEKRGMKSFVFNVVHDDIWVESPLTEEVTLTMAIMRWVMDNPQQWLHEFLPGYDSSWINIPIIGEGEIGISPKDAFGMIHEPDLFGNMDLILKVKESDDLVHEWKFDEHHEDIREILTVRRIKV